MFTWLNSCTILHLLTFRGTSVTFRGWTEDAGRVASVDWRVAWFGLSRLPVTKWVDMWLEWAAYELLTPTKDSWITVIKIQTIVVYPLSRPFHWYNFQPNPFWWDGPFKGTCTVAPVWVWKNDLVGFSIIGWRTVYGLSILLLCPPFYSK